MNGAQATLDRLSPNASVVGRDPPTSDICTETAMQDTQRGQPTPADCAGLGWCGSKPGSPTTRVVGPLTAGVRGISVFRGVAFLIAAVRRRRDARRVIAALSALDDAILEDIGVRRGAIEGLARAFVRNGGVGASQHGRHDAPGLRLLIGGGRVQPAPRLAASGPDAADGRRAAA